MSVWMIVLLRTLAIATGSLEDYRQVGTGQGSKNKGAVSKHLSGMKWRILSERRAEVFEKD
jgi:hypothetical protein